MSTQLKNLSSYDPSEVPSAEGFTFAIVTAEWNPEITGRLLEGALSTLKKHGAKDSNITSVFVPGSYELTSGAHILAEKMQPAAIICLGCVIQGETPHFDFICQAVSQGLTNLSLKYKIPVIFGVLTTLNQEQALDRAGGKHGNKGDEAAITAIKMACLQRKFI